MANLPKHLRPPDTPQVKGRKYETKLAKTLGGRVATNSGATFGENDIIADYCEVEAKLTTNESYSLKAKYFREVKKKCSIKKIPLMIVNFEKYGDSYAIIPMDDFEFILETLEKSKS